MDVLNNPEVLKYLWDNFLSNVYDFLRARMKNYRERPFDHSIILKQAIRAYQDVLEDLQDQHYNRYDELLKIIQAFQTDELVRLVVNRFEQENDVKKPEIHSILKNYQEQDWFDPEKSTLYFNRYKDFLLEKKHWNPFTVDEMGKCCQKTLKHCANPHSSINILKRGMVVSDVQSGKTSNYIGLIDLAIDYDYKQILVLLPNVEALRKQTQKRIDEGVTGYDDVNKIEEESNYFGVGLFVPEEDRKKLQTQIISLTNISKDYLGKTFSNSVIGNAPVIMVVKKNARILAKVEKFFEPIYNNNTSRDNILIIDDECDYASINTKKEGDSPTAINKAIRSLLSRFKVSTYVGYTATPFANIFIKDDDTDENADLFPADFIDLVVPSGAYFGFNEVLGEEKPSDYIILLDENEKNFLPAKVKKNDVDEYRFKDLADSLKSALLRFLLVNTALTLEGNKDNRSMMVNITIFNNYHDLYKKKIDDFLVLVRQTVDQDLNSRITPERIAKSTILSQLQNLYENDLSFQEIKNKYPFTSPDFIRTIKDEANHIQTTIANNKNAKNRYVYPEPERGEEPSRIIQIGGYVLSRGLTLEGLVVSYFNRTSSYYDTLIQMGRWCGYRSGRLRKYVRLYMTESSYLKFRSAYDSTLDLYDQFKQMSDDGKSPSDFGLQVREDPDILETTLPYSRETRYPKLSATSPNKSRNSEITPITFNFTGRMVDNSKIPYDGSDSVLKNEETRQRTINFIHQLGKNEEKGDSEKIYWTDVEPSLVKEFISGLHIDEVDNPKFNIKGILSYFDEHQSKWDVAIAKGRDGDEIEFGGYSFKQPRRSFAIDEDSKILRISGSHNTILDPNILTIGIEKDQKEIIREFQSLKPENAGKKPGYPFYLSKRERPILIIYALNLDTRSLKDENTKQETNTEDIISRKKQIKNYFGGPVMAYAIGFNGEGKTRGSVVKLKYRINMTKKRELENSEEIEAFETQDGEGE